MHSETNPDSDDTADPRVSRDSLIAADPADAPEIAEALADELEAELEHTNRETAEESL